MSAAGSYRSDHVKIRPAAPADDDPRLGRPAASDPDDDQAVNSGVVPRLGAHELVAALRYDPEQVQIEPVTFRQVASSSLTLSDVFDLVREIDRILPFIVWLDVAKRRGSVKARR